LGKESVGNFVAMLPRTPFPKDLKVKSLMILSEPEIWMIRLVISCCVRIVSG
ncbi:hypothetical protein A2U01_0091846, partial [Trifolium medium]|nr:hypothetical protein [Trifolium medium]